MKIGNARPDTPTLLTNSKGVGSSLHTGGENWLSSKMSVTLGPIGIEIRARAWKVVDGEPN